MSNDYEDFLISKDPELTSGIIERKITGDFIMDLYDKYRTMEDGEIKETFYATIKVFEDHIGEYLILTSKN